MKKSIWRAWPFLIIALAVALCTAVLEGLISIYTMNIIDATIAGNNSIFIGAAKKLLVMALILLPTSLLLSYTKGLYKVKAARSVKGVFIERVFNKNINEFQKDNNSKYISSLTNDMNTIEMSYIDSLFEVGVNIIYFIVGFAVIASVSPYALGIGVVIGIVSTGVSMLLGKPIQKHQAHRSELFEGYTTYIKEVLSAFQIIKANNLNGKVQEDFYRKSKDIQHKGYVIDKIYTYISSVQSFTINLAYFSLLAVVAYMSIKGSLTTGGVILIVNNMSKVISPLMQFAEWFPKILSSKPIFKKLDEVLMNYDNHVETIAMNAFNQSIEFNNVSFSYDENEVLRDVNFSIEKGGKYLVIGPSGGGKSTLLKLLRKYFLPKEGEILIDNQSLKDIKKASYFNNISNVEQQVFLFEDTLRNNITLYKDYSEEEIIVALKRAGLSDFVKALPQGIDTMILDNGKNISGGERSRVAIARGLLGKRDIIFLDEAFASLDSTIAREIENTLLNLEGITVVNISHIIFEDTKKKYDKVFVVKNKTLSEVVMEM
ncbi:ABC transporter ATP-binding protein [Desnuesiella massiliensis]|uniref:ABC transporter ATP-binding protein n=1 Tax=Desnuesiella massiliensis TaxID=1650662 RepID=UPI0006E1DD32|nr:ABC transporter ATP-binding protein [Desnuesiella massiliensis]